MPLTENEVQEDIGEEDAEEDDIILKAQDEIIRRFKIVGPPYPFRIDESGQALCFTPPVTKAGSVYLFCLFLSHAFDRSIIPKKLAPKVTSKERRLFQACSTVAAGGFLQGPAISFGWPRPDNSAFLVALQKTYTLFGDGTPHHTAPAAASKAIKDGGIDIVAWRRAADQLPGTFYMIAQVASGADWDQKSVMPDRRHFHSYWFLRQPGSPVIDAMFMPFDLEPNSRDESTPYETVLVDYMQSITTKFGLLFYRHRLTRYFSDGLRLINEGEVNIEGHLEAMGVTRWVDKHLRRLRTA